MRRQNVLLLLVVATVLLEQCLLGTNAFDVAGGSNDRGNGRRGNNGDRGAHRGRGSSPHGDNGRPAKFPRLDIAVAQEQQQYSDQANVSPSRAQQNEPLSQQDLSQQHRPLSPQPGPSNQNQPNRVAGLRHGQPPGGRRFVMGRAPIPPLQRPLTASQQIAMEMGSSESHVRSLGKNQMMFPADDWPGWKGHRTDSTSSSSSADTETHSRSPSPS